MHGTGLIIGAMLAISLARMAGPLAAEGLLFQVLVHCLLLPPLLLAMRWWLGRRLRVHSAQIRLTTIGTGLIAGTMLWWLFGLGLARLSVYSLPLLAPAILLLLTLWWLESGIGGEDRHLRLALLRQRWRFGLLLPLVLVLLHDVLLLVGSLPIWRQWLGDAGAAWLEPLLSLLVFIGLLIGMAPLLATIWSARRLPGVEAERLQQLCERAGVRIRGIWHWPRFDLPFYNAMAVGLLGPFRAIFISRDLMQHMADEQVDAVIGHEIGHLRYHHHLLYLLLVALALLYGVLAETLLLQLLGDQADSGWGMGLQLTLLLLYLLLVGRGLFGLLSRACERQADLQGAELAGSTGAMRGALMQVARLAGQPLEAPSWRHHSIATRIAFLDRVRRDPGLALWHHWYISMLRLTLVILLVLALVISAVAGLQRPDLGSMMADDPVLRTAITEARQGDGEAYYSLIAAAEPVQRQSIALAVLMDLSTSSSDGLPDPRPLYQDRALLEPFLRLSTGRPALQLQIRNALAYALVAGTDQPSDADLAQADELGSQLRAAFEAELDPELEASYRDTLGAIALRLGRSEEATDQFARALKLVVPLTEEDPQLERFQALLERRLAAAEAGEELPLEWTPDPVDANDAPMTPDLPVRPDGQTRPEDETEDSEHG